jgi:prevent-host-death family protein
MASCGNASRLNYPHGSRWRLKVRKSYYGQMKRATLTETKNNLSALVDQVQHGETILILDRGRPVARLESVVGKGSDPEGRLARLERQGLLRRATAPLPREILMANPPKPSKGASILEALLAERRDDR